MPKVLSADNSKTWGTIEASKRLYENEAGIICQPAKHLEPEIYESAEMMKMPSLSIYRSSVLITPELIPHKNQNWEVDEQVVRVDDIREIRYRPKFNNWALDFRLNTTQDRLSHLAIKMVLAHAGYHIGVGDGRPRFGLFQIIKFAEVKDINAKPDRQMAVRFLFGWRTFQRCDLPKHRPVRYLCNDKDLLYLLYPKKISSNTQDKIKRLIVIFNLFQKRINIGNASLKQAWKEYNKEEPSGYKYSQFVYRYHEWRKKNNIKEIRL